MLYAICPYCNKSISFSEGPAANKCIFCGQVLANDFLEEKGAFIDVEQSNKEYADAKLYFDNSDFRGAGEHFEKALKLNPNNYLANYFHGLCEAYENDSKEEFNVPLNLIKTLINSIIKMENSMVELKYKTEFLAAALNELHIIVLSQYKRILDKYNNVDGRKTFRKKGLDFLRAINELLAVDTEHLLVFDKAIASSLVGMTDIAITAAHDLSTPHLDGFDHLDILSDTDFNTLNGFYNNFVAYATKLDPRYKASTRAVDYTEVQQYNKDVLLLIDKYYTFNKDNSKKRLSLTGEILDNLNRQCYAAVMLTYYTCVRNIGIVRNDNIRTAIVNQAIAIAYERLLPRLFIDSFRRVNASVGNLKSICDVTQYLDKLVESLPDNMKKVSNEVMDTFYRDVYNTVSLYFEIVNKNYTKVINKLKKTKNDEYRYYRDFLFDMSLCCSTALCSVIKTFGKKMKQRLNLLKLAKKICEEFLLLCDYRVAAIEASPKFADILKIYGSIDYDIEFLSKLK